MQIKTRNKFLTRFAFLVLMHFIFKTGDYSFEHVFDLSFRGNLFTLFFFTYWLLVWYLAEYINKKFLVQDFHSAHKQKRTSYLLFLFHAVFAFLVAFSFNVSYRIGDLHLFDNDWQGIPLLNPELTVSLFGFYLMVFAFDIYVNSIVKKKEGELQLEKLKQENIMAKYLNLKSQIEPHFLFNSLSVLSSLIYTNVDLASDFILKLSKILRYVIERNDRLLVPLEDEMAFVNDYLFLMNTRFEAGIVFQNNIESSLISKSIIAPISIQLLIENAIKHNKFNEDEPLCIQIDNDTDYLIVRNNLNLLKNGQDSTKKGLDNLSKRFSYLTNKTMKVEMTDTEFVVYLPILSSEKYESANF